MRATSRTALILKLVLVSPLALAQGVRGGRTPRAEPPTDGRGAAAPEAAPGTSAAPSPATAAPRPSGAAAPSSPAGGDTDASGATAGAPPAGAASTEPSAAAPEAAPGEPETAEGASSLAAAPRGPVPAVTQPPAEAEPPARTARDTVGAHLAVGANAGLLFPFGSIESGVSQNDSFGTGYLLGGDITYGVSRTVMVGAYGEVGMPSDNSTGGGRSISTVAAGPLVRYHLVQGTRFDPWLSYGIGFRRTSDGTSSLTGLDWARLQVGGDWYPFSQLGVGPYAELALGTFLASSDALGAKAVNAHFILGLRLVYDSPGK